MTHPAAMAWCTISIRHDSVSRERSYSSLAPSQSSLLRARCGLCGANGCTWSPPTWVDVFRVATGWVDAHAPRPNARGMRRRSISHEVEPWMRRAVRVRIER